MARRNFPPKYDMGELDILTTFAILGWSDAGRHVARGGVIDVRASVGLRLAGLDLRVGIIDL